MCLNVIKTELYFYFIFYNKKIGSKGAEEITTKKYFTLTITDRPTDTKSDSTLFEDCWLGPQNKNEKSCQLNTHPSSQVSEIQNANAYSIFPEVLKYST